MQLDLITRSEYDYNKVQQRRAWKTLSVGMVCAGLMLFLISLQYYFFGYLYRALTQGVGYIISLVNGGTWDDGIKVAASLMYTEGFRVAVSSVIQILIIVLPFVILMRYAKIDFRDSFRVNTNVPKKFWFYIITAIGFCLGVVLVLSILFGELLQRFNEGSGYLPTSVWGVILYFVYVSLIPGIFEEWAFRGVLLRALTPYGKVFALVVSSVVFGLMHRNPIQSVFAAVFGLFAGFIYLKTGSIWYGVIIHALNNAFSIYRTYLITRYDVLDAQIILIGWVNILLVITGVAGTIYFFSKKYFNLKKMHATRPPENSKLTKKQQFITCLNALGTYLFVIVFVFAFLSEFYYNELLEEFVGNLFK